MKRIILENLNKDKYYDYLKENSHFIKQLNRYPNSYNDFKEFIKTNYHLRITDKVENIINDIEMVSEVVETLK